MSEKKTQITRYMDLDSTYRDRIQWPLPGNFQVKVVNSLETNPLNAQDPISYGAPELSFIIGKFDPGSSTKSYGSLVTVSAIVAVASVGTNRLTDATCSNEILITTASGRSQEIDNYYNGAVIEATATLARVRIKTSKFMGYSDTGLIRTLLTSESTFPKPDFGKGNSITIKDPSDEYVSGSKNLAWIFIPGGSDQDNAYIGRLLYISNIEKGGQGREIISYNGTTHLAKLNGSLGQSGGPFNGEASIIRELPKLGNNTSNDGYTLTNGNVYQNTTQPVNLNVDPLVGQTVVQLETTTLPAIVDNFFQGDFLRFVKSGDSEYGKIYRIVKSSSSGLVVLDGHPPQNSTAFVNILEYTRDNSHPVTYDGREGIKGLGKYQIELISLTIPNRPIKTKNGGRAPSIQYLYIELRNIGSSSGNRNILYSNNPNSPSTMFRAPIDDVQLQSASLFLKIDGDGTVQTVYFDPSRAIGFSVKLSDGTIFQTDDVDTSGPVHPNHLLQISATFSLTMVS